MGFLKFLTYNNAVPIAVSIMLLGGASTFAATNPEAIYSTEQHVLSIDNTYLVNKDLSTYTPRIDITGVTENDDFYFVAYTLSTIDLREYVWQDVVREETMKVSKEDLGTHRDLGVYATVQLKQIIDSESSRLAHTQEIEKKNESRKVVATEYSGLVGRFLDSTTEELPGYTPVVELPPGDNSQIAAAESSSNNSPPSGASSGGNSAMQLLGNNPAHIPVGTRYADLGVVVTDPTSSTLDIITFVNRVQVPAVSIDTSGAGEWTVRYEFTDKSGRTSSAERTVIVFDTAPRSTSPGSPTASSSTPDASSSEATSSDAAATSSQ